MADDGCGMSPEILAHIFDPFYTTKAPGKGRGLGLAVCQRVVGDAGGRIDVRSTPGLGSEFTVWLKKAEPI
jgi:C4-dicarboxylate-specific signal transduction histidine kinase